MKIPKGGNQNRYIEEEQTTQWSKEKVQKDKQRSTKHAHKTKDRVTRTPLKSEGELGCSVIRQHQLVNGPMDNEHYLLLHLKTVSVV